MKVCDVVINSVWYDPRVRKQIIEYKKNNINISCVGYECDRYNEEKILSIPCKVNIVRQNVRYKGKQKNILKKLIREYLIQKDIIRAIIDEKPDIIHANDLDALQPSYIASKKLKCKLIYDSHEIYTENYYLKDKKMYKLFLKIVEKFICKKVDKMVCVSNAAAEYFEKKYHIEKPIVITNSCMKSEIVLNEHKNQKFEVLNHGMFYEGRGYDTMVQAAKYLVDYNDINLILRGFGKLESKLKSTVNDFKLKNVIFMPKVDVEDLILYASKSMVGIAITNPICLNFELSVSNKLFEYAAAGLPVIMSKIPEHVFLNNKYHFGIILEDNTPKSLSDAILKLYKDKALYLELSKNALKMSNDIYWEKEFGKLIRFEKTLIGR